MYCHRERPMVVVAALVTVQTAWAMSAYVPGTGAAISTMDMPQAPLREAGVQQVPALRVCGPLCGPSALHRLGREQQITRGGRLRGMQESGFAAACARLLIARSGTHARTHRCSRTLRRAWTSLSSKRSLVPTPKQPFRRRFPYFLRWVHSDVRAVDLRY